MHYASGTTFLFGVIFLALIEIRNLCKTFGTGSTAVHALEDVSLDIEAGEIFGIIGLSGAGKSTLVRCMNLLERPTSGTVTVDGVKLSEPYINEFMLAPTDSRMGNEHVVVPEGSIFVMGDNRNHSADSRDLTLGTVDERYVLGCARLVLFPFGNFGKI